MGAMSRPIKEEEVAETCSSKPLKSRRIKIKRSRDYYKQHQDDVACECDRCMYAEATWRMYHRISSFRQARAQASPTQGLVYVKEIPTMTTSKETEIPAKDTASPMANLPIEDSLVLDKHDSKKYTLLHDEVFVLDL